MCFYNMAPNNTSPKNDRFLDGNLETQRKYDMYNNTSWILINAGERKCTTVNMINN